MTTFFIRILATLFLCTIAFSSVFPQKIVLEEGKDISSLGSSLSYFIDSENKGYTIEEVRNTDFDAKWQKNKSEHLNLGYLSVPVWLRVSFSNESKKEDWQFVLDMPFTDSISFYQEKNRNLISHSQTGWLFPYNSRGDIKNNGFTFPLQVSSNEEIVCYLRIRSNYPVLLPISVLTKEKAHQEGKDSHIGHGIYFGVLLVMMLYNLVIFLMIRDNNYLYYVLTIIFTFLTFAGVSGYLFKYIYPDFAEANLYFTRAAMVATVITASVFTIKFLQLKESFVWLYRLFVTIIIIAFISYPINYLLWGGAINAITKLLSISLLGTGIYCWVKGNKFARFFVLAWGAYIIGGLMITLRNSGTLPINFLTNHGANIGSALEVVLISIALADRYRTIRKEKNIATKKALSLEKQSKEELEIKVKERTQKLNESNEELAQINNALSTTVEVVEKQKTEIEIKSTAIKDSLNYAKRIQEAILPSQNEICSYFEDCFTFYLPKDVVSGDFYFFLKKANYTFVAVADCTGHGVPGSLMSMIGINLLREVIVENDYVSPSQILIKLHQEVVDTLHQKETGNRDGMDISLCIINKTDNKIYFSGAKNSLLSIMNGKVTEYKGSRFSIGGSLKTEGITFEDKVVEIDNQASYYMYSDGYQDQFGGESNQKFMRKNLKNLLQTIHKFPFDEQRNILETTLEKWKSAANASQIDDILVMGFKI
ncbi:7TM diverse intracellular signaling domain-containing protein [Bernardetia sp. ABR2-2B]|uniref:7TM diverse intracellular signaling domain-containing protein n=1 Tax=Bernardetia sp. ABR2-2B TaxID=3127472 RepID=UPI0030CB1342